MNQINSHKAGLALGALFGGIHLLWSIVALFGFAQPLLDFIFMLHMVKPVFTIPPFSFVVACTLILVTAMVGYLVGSFFARIWNTINQ